MGPVFFCELDKKGKMVVRLGHASTSPSWGRRTADVPVACLDRLVSLGFGDRRRRPTFVADALGGRLGRAIAREVTLFATVLEAG